jgi:translocation and assembly module TamA
MPTERAWQRWLLAALLCVGAAGARADIEINISGVDDAPRANIEGLLSIARFRDRDDLDEDTVQRLANRIVGEVELAMEGFGYYEPQVKEEHRQVGRNWVFDIRVEPGMPVRIQKLEISISGPGANDPIFDSVRNQTALRAGARLFHPAYEEVKGMMTRAAAANGYLDAHLLGDERSHMLVNETAHTVDIDLRLDTGPRYRFGEINIDQDVIRPGLMRRFLRFNEDDPYDISELLRTQFALDDSLYFSTVDVEPGDPDREKLTVPVRITAMKSRYQVALGGGYGTDTGVRGTLGWTNTRLNDRGHRLRFELKASASTRRIDSRYDIPIGDPALERFSVEALNRFEEISDLDTNETTLRPSVTRAHGQWQTISSLSFTHTTTDDGANRFTSTLVVPGLVLASVPEGFLGEALFSRGFYAELIGSHSNLGSDADFLRLDLRAERKFDLSDRWHLLLRGEFGTSLVSQFSDVPGIYRFFAGGDQSVRGFAYNSLSPEEPVVVDGVTELRKTGGRHLVVRDLPWWNLAAATFFDFGNAFNSFKDPIEYAAGVGIRYRVKDLLSVGLDVAKPLSSNGDMRLHLNISTRL